MKLLKRILSISNLCPFLERKNFQQFQFYLTSIFFHLRDKHLKSMLIDLLYLQFLRYFFQFTLDLRLVICDNKRVLNLLHYFFFDLMSSISSTLGKKTYKVVLLGETSTGKTSIIERFVNNKFEQRDNPTIGIDFLGKNITYKNIGCRLQLWDTAGQERYRSLIPSYLKDATCAIFVFDISRPQTLENLENWIDLFRHNRAEKSVLALCGNKVDLNQHYDQDKLNNLSAKYKMSFHEVSAKECKNIDRMFLSILEEIIIMQQKKKTKIQDNSSLFAPLTTQTLKTGTETGQNNQKNKIKLTEKEENDDSIKKWLCC